MKIHLNCQVYENCVSNYLMFRSSLQGKHKLERKVMLNRNKGFPLKLKLEF